jgi:serine/threonine protein kinase
VGVALTYAHSQGIIHRDVKPSNILVVNSEAKVIDFGLARALAQDLQETLGAISGTVSYLAPEQAHGLSTDVRTDVYGLASVFYELLTRRNPNEGTYTPLSELNSRLPVALDLVIAKAREQDPTDRYPTVGAFVDALRRIIMPSTSARLARFAQISIERGWWIWLIAMVVLGFIVPELQLGVVITEVSRYLALGLAITLLSGIIARPLTLGLARRAQSAEIAIFGPSLGLAQGVAISLFLLHSIAYPILSVKPSPISSVVTKTIYTSLGAIDRTEYIGLIPYVLVLSITSAVIIFLTLPLAAIFARRLGRSYASGFFTAFLLLTGLLIVLTITSLCGTLFAYSIVVPASANQP